MVEHPGDHDICREVHITVAARISAGKTLSHVSSGVRWQRLERCHHGFDGHRFVRKYFTPKAGFETFAQAFEIRHWFPLLRRSVGLKEFFQLTVEKLYVCFNLGLGKSRGQRGRCEEGQPDDECKGTSEQEATVTADNAQYVDKQHDDSEPEAH
jgi:hypothetical protein